MSPKIWQQSQRLGKSAKEALSKYQAALEKAHPEAKGRAHVVRRGDEIYVCVPLPTRERQRMRLFERMAEVGTDLLMETGHCFILTSQ